MEKQYSLKYGKGALKATIDSKRIIATVRMKNTEKVRDVEKAVRDSINHPIGTMPFKENFRSGKTVAIIVNDSTRDAKTELFLPILLDELNACGINDKDITVLFALGAHREMDYKEMAGIVGDQVAGRVRLYCGDCRDQAQFTYFGKTSFGTEVWFHQIVAEADYIIATGSVLFHYFAGYGGGRKAMHPGVASYESIRQNHQMMFEEDAGMGLLKGNPIYDDQIEAVRMCPPTFLLNTVLNENSEIIQVFSGDYIEAHLEACKYVSEVYSSEIEEKADIVIASAGGSPKDINVYQLHKTMINAGAAVKDGGICIIVGECREGIGSTIYEEIMRDCSSFQEIKNAVQSDFQIGKHKAYSIAQLMQKAEYILVSELREELSRLLMFTPAGSLEEAIQMADEKSGKDSSILLLPQGSLTVIKEQEG